MVALVLVTGLGIDYGSGLSPFAPGIPSKPYSASSSASVKGYWLVSSDGGIFAFGDAQFFGSTGGMTLNKPVVGMSAPSLGLSTSQTSASTGQQSNPTNPSTPSNGTSTGTTLPSSGTAICGQSILQSPYSYSWSATTFTSGEYGLPTFGTAGTDFPDATLGMIVPPGTLSTGSNNLSTNGTVYYFEPGLHTIINSLYTGNDDVYVGGYDPTSGEATLDGADGVGGYLSIGNGNVAAYATWRYLTIQNFASNLNGAVMGVYNRGGFQDDVSYLYDTIGPNMWSNQSGTLSDAQDSGAGYAIGGGTGTTVEYDCITHDGQGGINVTPGYGDSVVTDAVVSHNEFSYNGLGNYPDIAGGSGPTNPYACGCSGDAGKFTASLDFTFTDNYVHNGYAPSGIWGDTNNSGADISGNYIADNWGRAIDWEADYNANISDNNIVDNGWASSGAWPTSPYSCYDYTICANGLGPVGGGIPYAAIWITGSGGNALVGNNYNGQILVQSNDLTNNYGAIEVYSDTENSPGGQPGSQKCNNPLVAQQTSTYYLNWDDLYGASPTFSTSGGVTTVTISGGIHQIRHDTASDPATNELTPNPLCQIGATYGPVAPTAGMYVFGTGIPAGDRVAANPAPTATAFSLTAQATSASGNVAIGSPGGCGIYDLYGTSGPGNSGSPAADYWTNCSMGSRNILVENNIFSMDTNVVTSCNQASQCGAMGAIAFNAGVDPMYKIWDPYFTNNVAVASSPLHNIWENNTYNWTGNGYIWNGSSYSFGAGGSWAIVAGDQLTYVSHTTWSTSDGQDAGSSGL